MRIIASGFFLALILNACQPAAVTNIAPGSPTLGPTDLSEYYGMPEPVKLVINGETFDSRIGTTKWITEVQPDGSTALMIGDAFAIITPMQPIVTNLNMIASLKLPIPIDPIELWYILYSVSEEELASQDTSHGSFRWNPDYETQAYIQLTNLLLQPEQELSFSLEPGLYVLEVHAVWGGLSPEEELEADHGFLLRAEE